jgi:hypothetical protein
LTLDYELKKEVNSQVQKLTSENEMQKKNPARLLKVRNEIITGKMRVTQSVLEREENNAWKW